MTKHDIDIDIDIDVLYHNRIYFINVAGSKPFSD